MTIFSPDLAIHLLLCNIKIPISLTMLFIIIDRFILKHTNIIIYYPQGNGQAKSINKVFGTLLTKLVNEKGMTGMNTCPQFYSLRKLLLRLESIKFHFNLCTYYAFYYLQSTCYHLNQGRLMIQNPSKFKLITYQN
jgi:hypothetical protein